MESFDVPREQLRKYSQCRLTKPVISPIHGKTGISREHTAWVPANLAEEGAVLKIKQEDGRWEDGWVVAEVFQTMTINELNFIRTGWKNHRKQSDI